MKKIFMYKNKIYFISNSNKAYEINHDDKIEENIEDIYKLITNSYDYNELCDLDLIEEIIDFNIKILVLGNINLSMNIVKELNKFGFTNTHFNYTDGDLNSFSLILYVNYYENIDDLDSINNMCIENNIKWIKFIFTYRKFYIGPLFIPRQSSCYNCLHTRRISNQMNLQEFNEENDILKYYYEYEFLVDCEDYKHKLFYCIVVNEIVNISKDIMNLINTEIEFDTKESNIKLNRILKVPYCAMCGS